MFNVPNITTYNIISLYINDVIDLTVFHLLMDYNLKRW